MDGNSKSTAGSFIFHGLSEASSSEDKSDRKSAVMPADNARGLYRYCIDEVSDNEDNDLGAPAEKSDGGTAKKLKGAIVTTNPTRNDNNVAKEEESKERSVR